MNLEHKALDFKQVDLNTEGDGYKFSGYASVFNSNDLVGDTIQKGAFIGVLKKGMPKMFFNHDGWTIPIGKWLSIEEDEKGLKVVGELTRGNPTSEAVKAALQHGTLDGMSIGYQLSHDGYTEKPDGIGRIIHKFDALPEISIVTYPCEPKAKIQSVKSEDIEGLCTVRDLENFLRDAGGFSKNVAVAICAKARAVFSGQGEPDGEKNAQKQICERLTQLAKRFK